MRCGWKAGIVIPTLVGPSARITAVGREHSLDLSKFEIVNAAHSDDAAEKSFVALVRSWSRRYLDEGKLAHGRIDARCDVIRETGLRTARRLSHVFIMDVPFHPETLFITDAAINIFPDLDAKRDIVQNAIDLFVDAGLGTPRVALLSAVETVTSKIPSTIEAAALCKMADRGQITAGVLDGPLAFDNAVDPEAARIKGIRSEVAGRAQILVVPDLEAGNMLAKNLIFLSRADAAGIVLGARVPIVLTSRADSVRARMASCAVAVIYAHALPKRPQRRRGDRNGRRPCRKCGLLERKVSDLSRPGFGPPRTPHQGTDERRRGCASVASRRRRGKDKLRTSPSLPGKLPMSAPQSKRSAHG